jgi:hypothetical protein
MMGYTSTDISMPKKADEVLCKEIESLKANRMKACK